MGFLRSKLKREISGRVGGGDVISRIMYRLFLFDWDGTLADTHLAVMAALGDMLTRSGLADIRAEEAFSGRGHMTFDVMMRDICTAYDRPFPEFDYTGAWIQGALHYMASATAIKGAHAFLNRVRACREDAIFAIVSNGYYEVISGALPHFGFEDHFPDSHVIAQDQGFAYKPAPDMLLYAMERFRATADQTVMIGDSAADAAAAGAAGAASWILVDGAREPAKAQAIAAAGASVVAAGFDELARKTGLVAGCGGRPPTCQL